MKLLVKGWTEIPHSYAIVNCFQLVHLQKKYGNQQLEIYTEEMPYYRKEWEQKKQKIYPDEYYTILNSFKKWNGEKVDLVYNITFPYNIDLVGNIPKCVFYTSEFSILEPSYFSCTSETLDTRDKLVDYFSDNPNLYFTSPSEWSSRGVAGFDVPRMRNVTITHGVDIDIFKPLNDQNKRSQIRKKYGFKDSDIVMVNIGAMTGNKGILLILFALNKLVNEYKHKNYKLLLKGMQDLYTTKEFLSNYIQIMISNKMITKDQINNLLENHIVFLDNTLSFKMMNNLYNACDLYISPYIAEGFNLAPLEALASGLPVIISSHGSTHEYITQLYESGGNKGFIHQLQTQTNTLSDGKRQLAINAQVLPEDILAIEQEILELKDCEVRYEKSTEMRECINASYSWNVVAELLYDYFLEIIQDS